MPPTPPPFPCYFVFIKPPVPLSARYRKRRRYTNVVCCEVLSVEMSKTGRYTNVVCGYLKILHSEQNPGPSVAPHSFWGARTAFILSFLFLLPTVCCVAPRVGVRDSQSTLCCVAPGVGVRDSQSTGVWPLELGLGTHNPRFVVWPLKLGLRTHNPRFVAWPLELGLGTHNPRFVVWPLELRLGSHNPRFVAWPL